MSRTNSKLHFMVVIKSGVNSSGRLTSSFLSKLERQSFCFSTEKCRITQLLDFNRQLQKHLWKFRIIRSTILTNWLLTCLMHLSDHCNLSKVAIVDPRLHPHAQNYYVTRTLSIPNQELETWSWNPSWLACNLMEILGYR